MRGCRHRTDGALSVLDAFMDAAVLGQRCALCDYVLESYCVECVLAQFVGVRPGFGARVCCWREDCGAEAILSRTRS